MTNYDYKIVEGTKESFEKQLNELSNENYCIQGSLVITKSDKGENVYHQLVLKITTERTLNKD